MAPAGVSPKAFAMVLIENRGRVFRRAVLRNRSAKGPASPDQRVPQRVARLGLQAAILGFANPGMSPQNVPAPTLRHVTTIGFNPPSDIR
jgi:hypothetical protein